ncbi:MAG: hypothetical protein KDC34_04220 [Saprospiraceae bacterium]|nr:hypothetical protein [Saprospiraceae bacterium]
MANASSRTKFSLGSSSAKLVLQNLPFVFFLGFLATLYIANAHYAEKKIRDIQLLQREVKDLRQEYNSKEAEIMVHSRRSELSKRVKPLGLQQSAVRPKKIVVQELDQP